MIADIGRVEVTAAAAQPVLVRNELPSPGAPDRTGSVELLQRLTEAAGGEDAAFLNGDPGHRPRIGAVREQPDFGAGQRQRQGENGGGEKYVFHCSAFLSVRLRSRSVRCQIFSPRSCSRRGGAKQKLVRTPTPSVVSTPSVIGTI